MEIQYWKCLKLHVTDMFGFTLWSQTGKTSKSSVKILKEKIIFTHTITLPGVLILSFRSVQNQGDSLQLLLAEEQNILRVVGRQYS